MASKQPRAVHVDDSKKDQLKVKMDSMSREVSKATWDCWKSTESLWRILNAIPDDKIEKFEWDFILKSMGRKDEKILSQDDSDFLFMYLDKDNSDDISKPELRALLDLVVRHNKWGAKNSPTIEEMIKATYQYALNEKKSHSSIDYTLQVAIIAVKNKLTKLLGDIRSAKVHYGLVNKAITDNNMQVFNNPTSIFEKNLKEHEDVINKYPGPLKQRYDSVKQLLTVTEEEYNYVNNQVQDFLLQGRELDRLRDRDEKCCKILGCLCPCTFGCLCPCIFSS